MNASDVTIDLNGFSIIGPAVCTGGGFNQPPVSCTGTGTGRGIFGAFSITVTNGVIRGMGSTGISLSRKCRIQNVSLIGNGGRGADVLDGCIVSGSLAQVNGNDGFFGQSATFQGNTAFANAENGISCSNTCQISSNILNYNEGGDIGGGSGSIVSNNTVNFNKGVGIANFLGTVTGNTVLGNEGIGITSQSGLVKDNLSGGNTSFGLQITIESGYSGNILQNNNGGNASPQIFAGAGSRNLGQNMCGTALCPQVIPSSSAR